MPSPGFPTKQISEVPDVIAADGSQVRVLCQLSRGALATFTLPPGAVSKAVAHRTIEEVWYFVRGRGRFRRRIFGRLVRRRLRGKILIGRLQRIVVVEAHRFPGRAFLGQPAASAAATSGKSSSWWPVMA